MNLTAYLWIIYLGGTSSTRPLSDVVLDGIDSNRAWRRQVLGRSRQASFRSQPPGVATMHLEPIGSAPAKVVDLID
ncbi:hypothetical protein BS78_07G106700 [Paspalum vaginatum]|nr:hypothetical protein BS78_07G106700 [Paspalum vaginatum]